MHRMRDPPQRPKLSRATYTSRRPRCPMLAVPYLHTGTHTRTRPLSFRVWELRRRVNALRGGDEGERRQACTTDLHQICAPRQTSTANTGCKACARARRTTTTATDAHSCVHPLSPLAQCPATGAALGTRILPGVPCSLRPAPCSLRLASGRRYLHPVACSPYSLRPASGRRQACSLWAHRGGCRAQAAGHRMQASPPRC